MLTDLDSLFADFVALDWEGCPDSLADVTGTHVYALMVETGDDRFPLYVGQTRRILGRVGDYLQAPFWAPTDFRVGEAVKYLTDKRQCKVKFLYRPSEANRADEKRLIRELLLSGYTLLNFLSAFDHKATTAEEERRVVHRFCDMALSPTRYPLTK